MAKKQCYIFKVNIQNHVSIPIVKHFYTELIIEMSFTKKTAAGIYTGTANFKRITRNLFRNSVEAYG